VSVCLLASDLRTVSNSLVPVSCLASDLKSFVNSLVPDCCLSSDLRYVGKQNGTRELTIDLRSEARPTDWHSRVSNRS
jgi:hypothetical protein